MTVRRGTTNRNDRGSSTSRARRRKWLVETYRADTMARIRFGVVIPCEEDHPDAVPACRCYRCGVLLTEETVTADRIIPGCQGGTYARTNIRPACLECNSKTGGATRGAKRAYVRKKAGDRFGQVVLVEYLGIQDGNGYWRCLCDCGTEMRVQSGQFKTVRSCGKGICNSQYKDEPSYQRAHNRVAEKRGRATEHACVDCEATAREWSYDGQDPDELKSEHGYTYSVDVDRYVPRCIRCHRKHDYRRAA